MSPLMLARDINKAYQLHLSVDTDLSLSNTAYKL